MEKELNNQYLSCLLEGNRRKAQELCISYLKEGHEIKTLYEQVIKPALYEVGRLWEQNQITVATEHLATAITEGILNALYSNIIPDNYLNKKVVLACVDKEEHQVGIKMVADVFEMNQWESYFLGTGFPTSELIKYIQELKPDLIAISLSVYFNFNTLKVMLGELKEAFPDLNILVGGQALTHVADKLFEQWQNVIYISDLVKLEEYIDNHK